jgi:predicted nucleotidyltransferase
MAEETELSPSTVSRLAEELEKTGIIELDREGIRTEIRATGNQRFRDLKKVNNLKRITESGIVDKIYDATVPEALVLFGSYSRGEDDKNSDIDIAIINGRKIDYGLEINEEINRPINIVNVDLEEVDKNFKETLANGIVLRGYIEL